MNDGEGSRRRAACINQVSVEVDRIWSLAQKWPDAKDLLYVFAGRVTGLGDDLRLCDRATARFRPSVQPAVATRLRPPFRPSAIQYAPAQLCRVRGRAAVSRQRWGGAACVMRRCNPTESRRARCAAVCCSVLPPLGIRSRWFSSGYLSCCECHVLSGR